MSEQAESYHVISTSGAGKLKMDDFDGGNLFDWELSGKRILKAKKLHRTLEADFHSTFTTVEPSSEDNEERARQVLARNKVIEELEELDNTALCVVVASLNREWKKKVRHCKTTYSVVSTIRNLVEKNLPSTIMALSNELGTKVYAGGDIMAHIAVLDDLSDRLEALNKPVSDTDKINHLMTSIARNKSFVERINDLRTEIKLSNRSKNPMTYDEVKESLANDESFRRSVGQASIDMVNHVSNRSWGRGQRGRGRGGRIRGNRRNSAFQASHSGRNNNTGHIKCYHCLQWTDHIAKDCPFPRAPREEKNDGYDRNDGNHARGGYQSNRGNHARGGYQGYRGNHAGGGFQIVGASRHARGGNSQGAYKVNPNQRVMGNKRYIDKGYTSISTRGRNVSSGSNDRSSGSNYDEYSGSYDGSGSYSGGGHGFRESIWVVKEKLFGSSELLADPSRMIIIDSGATNHYFKDADLFTTYHQLVGDEHIVEAANGGLMRKAGIGSVVVSFWNGNGFNRVQINNVFHLPGATANLLSVSQLEKIPGTNFEISGGLWQIRNGCYVDAIGVRVGGLYQIPILASEELSEHVNVMRPGHLSDTALWHARLGHPGENVIRRMVRVKCVTGMPECEDPLGFCETCKLGKQRRNPHNGTIYRGKRAAEVIFSDGIHLDMPTIGGKKYIYTFIDGYSGYVEIFLQSAKNETYENFVIFKNRIENATGQRVSVLHTDNGTEYINGDFKTLCNEAGIKHVTPPSHEKESNGIAEVMNRVIMDKVRCNLIYAGLSGGYWGEAALAAVYVLNRIPKSDMEKTPFELLFGKCPDLSRLRIFGCEAYIIPGDIKKRPKTARRSVKAKFMGYSEDGIGWKFALPTNKKERSTHAVFNENRFDWNTDPDLAIFNSSDGDDWYPNIVKDDAVPVDANTSSDSSDDEFITTAPRNSRTPSVPQSPVDSVPTPTDSTMSDYQPPHRCATPVLPSQPGPRRSTRTKRPVIERGYMLKDAEIDTPNSYREAMQSADAAEWRKAMQVELAGLQEAGTWDEVDRPHHKNIMKGRWVYARKKDLAGKTIRFKARYVAKGFTQVEGLDYFDNDRYAPVARGETIRLMLAL